MVSYGTVKVFPVDKPSIRCGDPPNGWLLVYSRPPELPPKPTPNSLNFEDYLDKGSFVSEIICE